MGPITIKIFIATGKTCTGKPDREKEGKTVTKYKICSPKEGMRCATEQDN